MFPRLSAILLFLAILSSGLPAEAAANPNPAYPKEYTDDFASNLAERFVAAPKGSTLPDLVLENAQGLGLNLKTFRGQYVLLNFWATWCGPCVREMPALDTLANLMSKKKFVIVALNQNSNGRDIATRFYADHTLTHLGIYTDPLGRGPALCKAKGLPTTILIDPKGDEIGRWEGAAAWDSPQAVAFLTRVLESK